MKTYECKNCKEQKLWVNSLGLCIQCEEEYCPICGSTIGNKPCSKCEKVFSLDKEEIVNE